MQVKEKESSSPQHESENTHNIHKMSPYHIIFFSALSRTDCCWAGIVRKKVPSHSCRNDLANGQPDTKDNQKLLVSYGQKLEKNGAVGL